MTDDPQSDAADVPLVIDMSQTPRVGTVDLIRLGVPFECHWPSLVGVPRGSDLANVRGAGRYEVARAATANMGMREPRMGRVLQEAEDRGDVIYTIMVRAGAGYPAFTVAWRHSDGTWSLVDNAGGWVDTLCEGAWTKVVRLLSDLARAEA